MELAGGVEQPFLLQALAQEIAARIAGQKDRLAWKLASTAMLDRFGTDPSV